MIDFSSKMTEASDQLLSHDFMDAQPFDTIQKVFLNSIRSVATSLSRKSSEQRKSEAIQLLAFVLEEIN